jgi:hypothetical protein
MTENEQKLMDSYMLIPALEAMLKLVEQHQQELRRRIEEEKRKEVENAGN